MSRFKGLDFKRLSDNLYPLFKTSSFRQAVEKFAADNPSVKIPLLQGLERNFSCSYQKEQQEYMLGDLKNHLKAGNIYPDSVVTLKIDHVLPSAMGVGFHVFSSSKGKEAWLILVPISLKNELVRARIYAMGSSSGYLYADLVAVDSKSEQRVQTKCQHYQECARCTIQHLSIENQLKFKQEMCQEYNNQIKKDIKIEPIVPSPKDWNYGSKMSLFYKKTPNSKVPVQLGYKKRDNSEYPVIVDSCPVVIQNLQDRLSFESNRIQANLSTHGNSMLRRQMIPTPEQTRKLKFDFFNSENQNLKSANEIVKEQLMKTPEQLTSVHNNSWVTAVADSSTEIVTDVLDGMVLKYPLTSKFRGNPFILPLIHDHVFRELHKLSKLGIKSLVHVNCGSSAFSVKSASLFDRILCIEPSIHHLKWTMANLQSNPDFVPASTKLSFSSGNLNAKLREMISKSDEFKPQETVVVFDNPKYSKTHAACLDQLLEFNPRAIIHATHNFWGQLNDVKILTNELGFKDRLAISAAAVEQGPARKMAASFLASLASQPEKRIKFTPYKIDRIQPFDTHPQIHKFENIVTLTN